MTRSIVLFSDTLDPKQLRELINGWSAAYDTDKQKKLHENSLILQLRFHSGRHETARSEFHTFRSFDNLHFPHKDLVLKEVDFFIGHKDWYEERGLPYTLGTVINVNGVLVER